MQITCITLIPVKKILSNQVLYRTKGKRLFKKRTSFKLEGKIRYKECGEIMIQTDQPFIYSCSNKHFRVWPPQEYAKKARIFGKEVKI